MSQLVYSPFSAFNALQRDINQRFAGIPLGKSENSDYETSEWTPQVDIHELEKTFQLEIDLPGLGPKDVEITLDKNILTIKGARSTQSKSEKKFYKRQERYSGAFIRQFTLPDSVDGEHISAKSNHGVLEVTIPKAATSQPLSIAVQG